VRFLRYLLISWALNAIVLGIVTLAFQDVTSKRFLDVVIAAAVFGVLNTIVKPLMRLLTLPLAVITLGLAWFGVSMFMLWLTSVLVSGFDIHGFWTYVWATVTVWAVNCVFEAIDYFWRRRGGGSDAAVVAH
jgi:putative membrane protein